MAQDKHEHNYNITSTVAKTDDGSIQINFSIPKSTIDEEQERALGAMAPDVTVPGFRKGKAPLEKVRANIAADKLLEKALNHILPHAFSDAIVEHKLKPAIFPKFEIISTGDEVWEVRANTCEIPDIEVGDYKQVAQGALKDTALWTPDKGDPKEKKEDTLERKQQKVIEALLGSIKVTVPQLLVEEEVNARLSQLLERIEKLGLNLDSYLASVGKTPDSLRHEYETQTRQAISLELILNKIAELEKVTVSESDINLALQAMQAEPGKQIDPSQKQLVTSVLRRRAVLDQLIGSL